MPEFMNVLIDLYEKYTGEKPQQSKALPVSGSHRRYIRLTAKDGRSLMGVIGTDKDENRAFIEIAKTFRTNGINVPEVYAVTTDGLCYLQEDLGDTSLYDSLEKGRKSGTYSQADRQLLRRTIAALPKIQFAGPQGLDFSVCYPEKEFSARTIDFDLNYFKYCYLKTSAVEFNEVALQDDFDKLKADLLQPYGDTFLYRDFQARNVMIRSGEPWFIDFQGGRRGPIYYDLASFIYQAKAAYPEDLREELLQAYLQAASKIPGAKLPLEDEFRATLRLFALFRTLQVLGAYGYRGRYEKKAHFIESIPFALNNLRSLLPESSQRYPYLTQVLQALCAPKPAPLESEILEIQVSSFSYRKGIPADESANGGGYVFDCRAVDNPGRYDRYKHSTGLDADVIEFLEDKSSVAEFLQEAYALVDAHVEKFLSRGFKHLQVSFGCTGGQHRSVFCAQKMAEHLHYKFCVRVKLCHIQLGITEILQ